MNRELFQKAQAYDPDAARAKYSENALASSLAVARSAPGGASREQALLLLSSIKDLEKKFKLKKLKVPNHNSMLLL